MIWHESSRLVRGFGRTNTITLPYCSLAFTVWLSRKSVKNQKKGSSRITGKRGFDLQKEEVAIPVPVGHPLHHFDSVIDAFELAGMHRPAQPGCDASPVRLEFGSKLS